MLEFEVFVGIILKVKEVAKVSTPLRGRSSKDKSYWEKQKWLNCNFLPKNLRIAFKF